MFDGQKYVTSGINASIPSYIQNILWYLIETMNVAGKDYLQVFELDTVIDNGQVKQIIVHKQKQPLYQMKHMIPVRKAITAKVFVIDDGSHCTMLLEEEC